MSRISKTLLIAGALGLAVTAIPAQAEQGDWLLRAGATMVSPKSGNLKLGDLGFIDGVGNVTNASLEVGDGTSLGLTVTYMLTDNWAIDLLAAVPFKHDIDLKASVDGVSGKGKIAETKHLPPTLSLQYHFLPEAFFSPYVGVGVNWTIFSSEKIAPVLADSLSLDDSFGLAGQVGADFNINSKWLINVDVRYIDISTKATIRAGGERVTLGDVNIDPLVYSLMVGYRF